MILAANPVGRNIAIVIAIVLIARAGSSYLLGNMRRAKAEVGSEIELAPNRKPYLDDEELEGPKLDARAVPRRSACSWSPPSRLPLYWLNEPSRQAGAIEGFDAQLREAGAQSCSPRPREGGFNCAGCHGSMKGIGGVARVHADRPSDGRGAGR